MILVEVAECEDTCSSSSTYTCTLASSTLCHSDCNVTRPILEFCRYSQLYRSTMHM